jgi:RNA polymerase sigma factor (sigma-70 family)
MTRDEAKQALAERRPMLLAVAARVVRAHGIPPDDVVQEAYLKALRAVEADAFPRERDHLLAWFTKVAYSAAYDALRGRLRQRNRGSAALDTEPADLRPGPVDELIEREDGTATARRLALLPRSIEQLPEDERKAVELRLEGVTNRQVAAELGIPAGSVSALFRSACGKLRQDLDREVQSAGPEG